MTKNTQISGEASESARDTESDSHKIKDKIDCGEINKEPEITDSIKLNNGELLLYGKFEDFDISIKNGKVTVKSGKYTADRAHTFEGVNILKFDDLEYEVNSNEPIAANNVIYPQDWTNDTIIVDEPEALKNCKSYSGSELSVAGYVTTQGLNVTYNNGKFYIKKIPDYKGFMYFSFMVQNAEGIVSPAIVNVFIAGPNYHKNKEFFAQWYLSRINLLPIISTYSGNGINIIVADIDYALEHEGIDIGIIKPKHQELQGSIDRKVQQHTLSVASIINAKPSNKYIVGIAPKSKVYSSDAGILADTSVDPHDIHIINCSWGVEGQLHSADLLRLTPHIKRLASTGRGGLGSIIVFAGGNQHSEGCSPDYRLYTCLPEVITVGGTYSSPHLSENFAEGGTSILVSAPAESIRALSLNERNQKPETECLNGTSFSGPIVSAVIALMLEANPKLSWHAVQEILAYSASYHLPNIDNIVVYTNKGSPDEVKKFSGELLCEHSAKIASLSRMWQSNGATAFNGGGFHTSYMLGFGEVRALEAVKLAKFWPDQHANEDVISTNFGDHKYSKKVVNRNNPVVAKFLVSMDNPVEFVSLEVELQSNTNRPSLNMWITSPAGTRSLLMHKEAKLPDGDYDDHYELKWRFPSRQFLGENPQGTWTVVIAPTNISCTSTINSLDLNIQTKAKVGNKQMIFTDEITKYTEAQRYKIDIDSHTSTLNLSALSTSSLIDLSGKVSKIGDKEFLLSGGENINLVILNEGGNNKVVGTNNSDCTFQVHGGTNKFYLNSDNNVIEFDHLDKSIGHQKIFYKNTAPKLTFADGTSSDELTSDKYTDKNDPPGTRFTGAGWSIELVKVHGNLHGVLA